MACPTTCLPGAEHFRALWPLQFFWRQLGQVIGQVYLLSSAGLTSPYQSAPKTFVATCPIDRQVTSTSPNGRSIAWNTTVHLDHQYVWQINPVSYLVSHGFNHSLDRARNIELLHIEWHENRKKALLDCISLSIMFHMLLAAKSSVIHWGKRILW